MRPFPGSVSREPRILYVLRVPSFDSNKTAKKVSIPVNSTIKDCVKYCNQAIKENPNGSYQYYMKGRFYVRLKKDKEAIKCFSKAIELDPQEADYYLERSNVKGLLGKIDDAIVDVKKAISIDPNCAIDLIAISIPEIQDSISAKELLDSLEMLKLNENNKHKK